MTMLQKITHNIWAEYGGDRATAERAALAALEAMKEPTENMINEGTKTFVPPDYASAEEVFRSMIWTIIQEKETT